MKKILLVFLCLNLYVLAGNAQQYSCPFVNGGSDVLLPCGTNCTTLRAAYLPSTATTSYRVDSIGYAPYSYTAGTVPPPSSFITSDDSYSGAVSMPFTFCFFGNSYTQLVVGNNGMISFDVANYANGGNPWSLTAAANIPSPNQQLNSIMGAYMDIFPVIGASTCIKTLTVGTAPCRKFIINFDRVPYFNAGDCPGDSMTSQIVLYETTNVIEIYIHKKPICTTWNGGLAIEGIQDATGTNGYAVPGRNRTTWSVIDDGQRFTPTGAITSAFAWYQGTTLLGTTDSIVVCPPSNSSTNYVAQITYTNCDNSTVVINDTVNIRVVQSAGPVQYVSCPTLIDSAVMNASGSGTWTALSSNPAPTVVVSPTSPNTSIRGFTLTGTYGYIWTNGTCTDTGHVIVTSRPNAGSDQSTCVNGIVAMSATGVGTWAALPGNPAPTSITSPTSPTTTITGFTVGGTYYYIWYVGNCQDTAVVNIPTFVATASIGDTMLCKYQSTTLTSTAGPAALGPFTFSWSSPTTVVSPNSANTATTPVLAPTTYTVLVTSATGCTLTRSVSVALAGAAPQVHVSPSDNNVCPGDTVTLNSVVFAESLVQCGLVDTLFTNNNTVTGYVANDTSSTTGPYGYTSVYGSPFMGSYKSYKAQYLIRKSELNAAGLSSGTITDFSFFIKTLRSTAAYDTFAVSMGCTNLDSLTGFVNNLSEVIPPLMGPQAPAAGISLYANSWNPFPFTHYFNWDGSSNIIIQICYTIPSNQSSADDFVSYSSPGFNGASVVAGNSFTTGVNGCDLAQGANFYSLLNTRPNFLFHISVPSVLTYQWTPHTIDCDSCPVTRVVVTTDTTYTLTVNDNGCANDTSARILINRNIAMHAAPDTTLCSGAGPVQLSDSLTNPPPSTCTQGYVVTSIPYSSISGNITTIPGASYVDASGFANNDDGTAGPFNIGFTFPFYCQTYSNFYVNANGWLSLVDPYPATSGTNLFISQTFPPTAPFMNPLKEIALMTGDYEVQGNFGGGGIVAYFVTGSPGSRILVVQFVGIQSLSGLYHTSGEVHLHEGTGVIEIMISSSNYAGTSHTTGIKDSTGIGVAAPGRNNQQYTVINPEGWRFTPISGSSVVLNNVVWSPNSFLSNDTIANPIATPPATQTYIATNTLTINKFTNPTTCVVRDTVTITEKIFNYTLSATPPTICPGDTSHLAFVSTDPVANYTWSPKYGLSDSTIGNPSASVLDTSKFYISATDSSGCKVHDSITVYVFPTIQPVLGPGATICYSDSFRLSLPGNYSNYNWYFIDTLTGTRTLVSSGAEDSIFYAHPSGDYVLSVNQTLGSCPNYTNIVRVDSFTRQPLLVDTSGPTGFCAGGNVTLQVAQGVNNIQWTPASYGSQPSFPVTASGTFSYTATDLHGCLLYSDTVHVTVNQIPVFAVNNFRNPICSNDRDTLIVASSPGGAQITWTFSGNTSTGDTFVATSTGSYAVEANLSGCISDTTLTLTGAPSPTVVLPTFPYICSCNPNTTVTPLVSSGTPGYRYAWSNGDTTATVVDQSLNLSTFIVTVTDANNCTAVSNSTSITISCLDATITGASLTTPPSDTVFLHDSAVFVAAVTGGYTYGYMWYSDSAQILSPSTNSTVYATANAPGVDSVYLIITDSVTGCRDTFPGAIHVIEIAGYVMPTAFTPNGDGVNDNFYPVLSDSTQSTAKIASFRIYNKWGQLVYDNAGAPGWNGFFGNEAQPGGVYTYFITISFPDPNNASHIITKTLEGSFTLLR